MVELRYLQKQNKYENIRLTRYRAAIDEHRPNQPTWDDYYWNLYSVGQTIWKNGTGEWSRFRKFSMNWLKKITIVTRC